MFSFGFVRRQISVIRISILSRMGGGVGVDTIDN